MGIISFFNKINKEQNLSASQFVLLSLLLEDGILDKSNTSKVLGVSRPAVYKMVNDLLEMGALEQIESSYNVSEGIEEFIIGQNDSLKHFTPRVKLPPQNNETITRIDNSESDHSLLIHNNWIIYQYWPEQ